MQTLFNMFPSFANYDRTRCPARASNCSTNGAHAHISYQIQSPYLTHYVLRENTSRMIGASANIVGATFVLFVRHIILMCSLGEMTWIITCGIVARVKNVILGHQVSVCQLIDQSMREYAMSFDVEHPITLGFPFGDKQPTIVFPTLRDLTPNVFRGIKPHAAIVPVNKSMGLPANCTRAGFCIRRNISGATASAFAQSRGRIVTHQNLPFWCRRAGRLTSSRSILTN